MTEAEWLSGADLAAMLWYLEVNRRAHQFKAGRRRARLLACAWCRPLLAWLPGEWGPGVVEVVESFADGRIGVGDLAVVREAARENMLRVTSGHPRAAARGHVEAQLAGHAAQAVLALTHERSAYVMAQVGGPLRGAAALAPGLPSRCEAVREVFGNPFRPVTLAPAWAERNDGAARRLAGAIYEGRSFGEAPVLADALEDAGCAEEALLAHLRGPGPHGRGCWAVDLVRGEG